MTEVAGQKLEMDENSQLAQSSIKAAVTVHLVSMVMVRHAKILTNARKSKHVSVMAAPVRINGVDMIASVVGTSYI